MTVPLLQIKNLSTWIDGEAGTVRAVDGISLDVARGETVALLGESGCGKSMTALSIMRLLPDAGQIIGGSIKLDGEELLGLSETAMRAIRGKRISMIFQEPMLSLNPVMTVGAQITECLFQHTSLRGDAARRRVIEVLGSVGIADPEQRIDEYPFQFSGGMKQRVMMAMALAGEPDLLIADEPTTALDVTIQAQVLTLMRELQKKTGMAILLITHDLGVVSEMADRVAVMYAGEIIEVAQRDDFFRNPSHPYSQKLFASLPSSQKREMHLAVIRGSVPRLDREFIGCRFAERCDYAWELCREQAPGWTVVNTSQQARCHLLEQSSITHPAMNSSTEMAVSVTPLQMSDAPLLRVDDLKVYFPIRKGLFKRTVGYVKAVDGVSLEIRPGKTLALVGESGSGKTTVGKGILQLLETTGGHVTFEGENLGLLDADKLRLKRRDIQIIFQDPYASLNPRMRVAEIIEEGMVALNVGGNVQQRQLRIDALLAQVGLSAEFKHRYPHEFSGGQRQRIAIARALAVEPKLIICDEPTSALDVSVQAQILNLLKHLQDSLGISYLFITHNISVVEYLADEVAVMYKGKIVEHGTVEAVLKSPQHTYTQTLLAAVPTIESKKIA